MLATVAAGLPSAREGGAPELAHLGPPTVGVRTVVLVDPAQPDVLAVDAAGIVPRRERWLEVDLLSPASLSPGAKPVTYTASFPSAPPRVPVAITVPGIAVRNAVVLPGPFPLVIVSHGYSNDPTATAWPTENLASKGDLVAAIRPADQRPH